MPDWPHPAAEPRLALCGWPACAVDNLFPVAVSVAVAVTPGQAALASGRSVAMSSFAVVLAPLTVGTLADTTSLQAALLVVPVMLMLAAAGLTVVSRVQTRSTDGLS